MDIIITALISAGIPSLVFLVGGSKFKRDILEEMSVFYNRIDKKIKNEVQNQVNEKVNDDLLDRLFGNVGSKASPIVLNEVGKSIIQDVKGEEWIEDNIDVLYKKFEGIDNRYDIQEKAKEVLLEWKDEIREDRKDLLYSTGTNINMFIAAMALLLRDMVFEKRGYKEVQNRK